MRGFAAFGRRVVTARAGFDDIASQPSAVRKIIVKGTGVRRAQSISHVQTPARHGVPTEIVAFAGAAQQPVHGLAIVVLRKLSLQQRDRTRHDGRSHGGSGFGGDTRIAVGGGRNDLTAGSK